MSRQKNDGKGRLGGRAKGTPNRATTDLKEWVAYILNNGREKFIECLGELEPMEYVRVFTGLLNYALPKQAPTTPDDVLRKEREMMQDLLLTMPEVMVERVSKRLYNLQKNESYENEIKQ